MYSVPNFSNKSVERLGQQQQNAYMNYNNTDYQNGNMQYEQHQQNMYQNRSQNNSQMQNIYQQPPNTNSQSSFSQPGQDSFMYFERKQQSILPLKETKDVLSSKISFNTTIKSGLTRESIENWPVWVKRSPSS